MSKDALNKNLLDAVYYGNLAQVENLLKAGAYIDSQSRTGHTALHSAAFALKTVLKYGEIDRKPVEAERTPQYVNIICLLIKEGSDLAIFANINKNQYRTIDTLVRILQEFNLEPALHNQIRDQLLTTRYAELVQDKTIRKHIVTAPTTAVEVPQVNVVSLVEQSWRNRVRGVRRGEEPSVDTMQQSQARPPSILRGEYKEVLGRPEGVAATSAQSAPATSRQTHAQTELQRRDGAEYLAVTLQSAPTPAVVPAVVQQVFPGIMPSADGVHIAPIRKQDYWVELVTAKGARERIPGKYHYSPYTVLAFDAHTMPLSR